MVLVEICNFQKFPKQSPLDTIVRHMKSVHDLDQLGKLLVLLPRDVGLSKDCQILLPPAKMIQEEECSVSYKVVQPRHHSILQKVKIYWISIRIEGSLKGVVLLTLYKFLLLLSYLPILFSR